MSLGLDVSKQFRSIAELTDLVGAIRGASANESEPDWLEWKREADLSSRRWHALIAKQIAGFANREPAAARRSAGGCGYLVLGLEPGNTPGISRIDNADLEAGIGRFIDRQRARWSPLYLDVGGSDVLVLTVEPPTEGAPILAISTEFSDDHGTVLRGGDIWVRRHGQTARATASEIDMLVRRAGSSRHVSGLSVAMVVPPFAIPVSARADEIEEWLEHEQTRLRRGPRRVPREAEGLLGYRDLRSEAGYDRLVNDYIDEAQSQLVAFAHGQALRQVGRPIRFELQNGGDENYAAVQVEVTLPSDVWAYESIDEAASRFPRPPTLWGQYVFPEFSTAAMLMPTTPVLGGPYGPHIDNSGPSRIVFDQIDLRPRRRYELDSVYLACERDLAGDSLIVKWTATSTSVNGVAEGDIEIPVSTEVIHPLARE